VHAIVKDRWKDHHVRVKEPKLKKNAPEYCFLAIHQKTQERDSRQLGEV